MVYGVSLNDGSNLSTWTTDPVETNSEVGSKVIISGGNLYVYEHGLYSINKSTGASNWSSQYGFDYAGNVNIPVVLDGKVYSSTNGGIAVYDASSNSNVLTTFGDYLVGSFVLPVNSYQDSVIEDTASGFWTLADISPED